MALLERSRGERPAVGDIVAGKYRIEGELGSGGMGVVLSAWHLELDQRVALKFMHDGGDELAVRRFLREARAAARVRSEHVARVTDFGRLPDGVSYIVMEHLDGTTLARVIDERGCLPADEAVDLVVQACDALAEAHANGIVHRDVKPSNLFLARRADGSTTVKLLDFGVAKAPEHGATADAASLTNTNDVVGSAYYMAPEQLLGSKGVTPACDVWALGVVLYELLCGLRPFDGETLPAVHVAIGTQQPKPLGELCPDVPAGLAEVVHACLRKPPAERPASIAALARALAPFSACAYTSLLVARIGRLREVRGDERVSVPPSSASERASERATVPGGLDADAFATATSVAEPGTRWATGPRVDPYGRTVGLGDGAGAVSARREATGAERTGIAMQSSIVPGAPPRGRRWPYAAAVGAICAVGVAAFVARTPGAPASPTAAAAGSPAPAPAPIVDTTASAASPVAAAAPSAPAATSTTSAAARPRPAPSASHAPARSAPPSSSAGGLFLPSGRK